MLKVPSRHSLAAKGELKVFRIKGVKAKAKKELLKTKRIKKWLTRMTDYS